MSVCEWVFGHLRKILRHFRCNSNKTTADSLRTKRRRNEMKRRNKTEMRNQTINRRNTMYQVMKERERNWNHSWYSFWWQIFEPKKSDNGVTGENLQEKLRMRFVQKCISLPHEARRKTWMSLFPLNCAYPIIEWILCTVDFRIEILSHQTSA